jgi:hypothetical protein
MFWPLEESAWSAECYNNEQGEDGCYDNEQGEDGCYNNEQGEDGCYNNEQGEEGRGGDLQLGSRGARSKHVDVGASDEVACGGGGGGIVRTSAGGRAGGRDVGVWLKCKNATTSGGTRLSSRTAALQP